MRGNSPGFASDRARHVSRYEERNEKWSVFTTKPTTTTTTTTTLNRTKSNMKRTRKKREMSIHIDWCLVDSTVCLRVLREV